MCRHELLHFGTLFTGHKDEVGQVQALCFPWADAQAPTVTRASPPGALELAGQLRAAGARMYGAFWCSHCFDQKQDFGTDAMAEFPYVECYPDGVKQVHVALKEGCTWP